MVDDVTKNCGSCEPSEVHAGPGFLHWNQVPEFGADHCPAWYWWYIWFSVPALQAGNPATEVALPPFHRMYRGICAGNPRCALMIPAGVADHCRVAAVGFGGVM